ncbi:MAG: transglutaminase TgpA family protein [Pseudonocardia sp.]
MVTAPPAPPRPAAPQRTGVDVPWLPALAVGLAVLLAAAPVSAVVAGIAWFGYAVAVVVMVAAAGIAAAPFGGAAVAGAQLLGTVTLLTVLFCADGVLGVLPGPGALREMAALAAGATEQIRAVPAPVPATPEICFLVALAVGLVAVAAHLVAVVAGAPAAAAVPLLVAFAVPTALADELLPWWTLVAGALAFGLLLVVGADRRRLAGAAAVTAGGVVLALVAGLLTTAVGTDGRFADAPRAGADIGLDPFTALRGQLTRTEPEDLLEVRGLPRPTYLRALTLRDYVPDTGWEAGRPDPGVDLTGPLPVPAGPGEQASIEIDNLAYRDYWLPLYGDPLLVTGVDDEAWAYDQVSGIAYTSLPTEEGSWEQRASLPAPTAAQLRAAGREGVAPAYLDTSGVDPRVGQLAAQVTAGRGTDFDRSIALLDHFTGPGSAFSYSLATAPGNGDDALVEFLTTGRTGYCEQFASAMAVMLRTLGVPARVAVGFTAGVESDDHRTVATADAHAWVEVWFAGQGWVLFDPTPLSDGRSVEPPYVAEARAESGAGAGAAPAPAPRPDPSPAPAPGEAPVGGSPEQDASDPAADGVWDEPVWPFLVVLLAGLAAATPAAIRAVTRRRRLAAVSAGGAGAASAAWDELLAESADRGVPGRPSDTVRGTARRIVREHRLAEGAQAALRQVVGAVESSWYGAAHPAPRELDGAVASLRSGIENGDPLGWRRRLLPRSVLGAARARVAGLNRRSRGRAPTR